MEYANHMKRRDKMNEDFGTISHNIRNYHRLIRTWKRGRIKNIAIIMLITMFVLVVMAGLLFAGWNMGYAVESFGLKTSLSTTLMALFVFTAAAAAFTVLTGIIVHDELVERIRNYNHINETIAVLEDELEMTKRGTLE